MYYLPSLENQEKQVVVPVLHYTSIVELYNNHEKSILMVLLPCGAVQFTMLNFFVIGTRRYAHSCQQHPITEALFD